MTRYEKVELKAPKAGWRMVLTVVTIVGDLVAYNVVSAWQTAVGAALGVDQVNGDDAAYAKMQLFTGVQWQTWVPIIAAVVLLLIWVPYFVKLARYAKATEQS